MESNPPELKRDGTMQVTAKEGAEFLKRTGAEDLIPAVDGEGDAKPAEIKRDTTMEATLKDGEAFLESAGKPDDDARTRAQQEQIEAASEVPSIPRDNTMQVTAKEGQEILGDETLGSTRAETEALRDVEAEAVVDEEDDEDDEDDDEGDEDDEGEEENGEDVVEEGDEADRANLKRTITMAETLQEGEEFLKRQKTNGEAAAAEEEVPQAEAAS